MILSRYLCSEGVRWKFDDAGLSTDFSLSHFLSLKRTEGVEYVERMAVEDFAPGPLMSPVEPHQEIWAAGVTYLRSKVEREAESTSADVYGLVYHAERPEIFFKSVGWRTVGHGGKIRVRRDSEWNVPEPELTVVLNRFMEVVGYTAGNDVSSRSIEGENPLYLPQAKMYDGSCALGPGIVLASERRLTDLPVRLSIWREGEEVYADLANTNQMKRTLRELAEHLGRETSFPNGAFLMTGTGIVPTTEFTLRPSDLVRVTVGELVLENEVE